jgi:hypothetical protein
VYDGIDVMAGDGGSRCRSDLKKIRREPVCGVRWRCGAFLCPGGLTVQYV